jgi:glutamine phosphoribosylpyrophosphate amidotransferase
MREPVKRRNELGYNVLVRHDCMERFISSKYLVVVDGDMVGLRRTTVIIFWVRNSGTKEVLLRSQYAGVVEVSINFLERGA